VVLDFDGTITLRDIGHTICRHFVGDRARVPIAAWSRGELSLGEAQARIWPMVQASESEVMALVAEVGTFRPGVDELLGACRARDWPVTIASGGFDFYVRHLLGERLGGLAGLYCNRGWFTPGGMAVDFPHAELACGRCSVCKGRVIEQLASAGRPVVFVGDGLSDRCAAGRADLLFTVEGRELAAHCQAEGIAHVPFADLGRVAERLVAEFA
jgi:2,3-diketo-5-methylthio-1-phosphopentane phosphatase